MLRLTMCHSVAGRRCVGRGRHLGGSVVQHRTPRVFSVRFVARTVMLTSGLAMTICCARAAVLVMMELGASSAVVAVANTRSTLLGRSHDAAVLTPRRLLYRAAWLLWSFSLALLLAPMAFISKTFCEQTYYRMLYDAIRYSRSAALAKWSQWASIRLDLLPATLCSLLSQFQADAPTHSLEHTLCELEAAGLRVAEKPTEGALVKLDGMPFASGSIAQVHAAFLDGQKVVVKVRHPQVETEMLLDFELLRRAAHVVHEWIPSLRWLNAPGTVSQFEAAMSGQCDLSQEARHLDLFRYNFRRKSSWMAFPKVHFASPAVLVESFEPGELCTHFIKRGLDRDRAEAHFLIVRGEDVYLQMLLVDNFMHADLHPGNMVFRKAGILGKPQMVLLDAGMAAELTADERRNFIGLLQAFGDGDGAVVAERVLEFSKRQPNDKQNFVDFRTDVCAFCAETCRGYGTGIDIGVVLRGMMQLMYRHGVSVDGNYATLIANMLCLEGLATQLEPRFNVMDVAYPLLRGHQLLGDKAFQQLFYFAQWFIPLSVWELGYRAALFAGMNGASLKPFQI